MILVPLQDGHRLSSGACRGRLRHTDSPFRLSWLSVICLPCCGLPAACSLATRAKCAVHRSDESCVCPCAVPLLSMLHGFMLQATGTPRCMIGRLLQRTSKRPVLWPRCGPDRRQKGDAKLNGDHAKGTNGIWHEVINVDVGKAEYLAQYRIGRRNMSRCGAATTQDTAASIKEGETLNMDPPQLLNHKEQLPRTPTTAIRFPALGFVHVALLFVKIT